MLRSQLNCSACARALQFSWERSMEALFGEVYPAAFACRMQQLRAAAAAMPASFAKA